MSTTLSQTAKPTRTDVFEALTDARRRRILAILDQTSPVSESELATLLAAMEHDTEPAAVDDEQVRTVRIDLVHGQLPALAEADLVAVEGDEVRTTARDVLSREAYRVLVRSPTDELDAVLDCLTSERRRHVLDVLAAQEGQLSRDALARAVVDREGPPDHRPMGSPSTVDRETRTVLDSLYHTHLPKLEAAGLVDLDEETVTYRENPALSRLRSTPLLDF